MVRDAVITCGLRFHLIKEEKKTNPGELRLKHTPAEMQSFEHKPSHTPRMHTHTHTVSHRKRERPHTPPPHTHSVYAPTQKPRGPWFN